MGAIAWKVLGTGSAVLAAAVASKALEAAWRAATGSPPPTIPEDPDTDWREAVAWAVVSGVVMGVARLAATRRAAQYYRASSGSLPKALVRRA
jgi:transposase